MIVLMEAEFTYTQRKEATKERGEMEKEMDLERIIIQMVKKCTLENTFSVEDMEVEHFIFLMENASRVDSWTTNQLTMEIIS